MTYFSRRRFRKNKENQPINQNKRRKKIKEFRSNLNDKKKERSVTRQCFDMVVLAIS